MTRTVTSKHRWRGRIALGIVLGTLGISSVALVLLPGGNLLNGQTVATASNYAVKGTSTGVFTPAHATIGLAVRHFFGLRAEPVQPIAYVHSVHIEKGMECLDCHIKAKTGPRATIPDVTWCMGCHDTVATDKPVIQQVAAYYNRGEDIPWQRVYGWNDEAHVRFNHRPHLAASISCAKCHGNVAGMTVARRVVDHTMEFCVTCHKERKASIDCISCHF